MRCRQASLQHCSHSLSVYLKQWCTFSPSNINRSDKLSNLAQFKGSLEVCVHSHIHHVYTGDSAPGNQEECAREEEGRNGCSCVGSASVSHEHVYRTDSTPVCREAPIINLLNLLIRQNCYSLSGVLIP